MVSHGLPPPHPHPLSNENVWRIGPHSEQVHALQRWINRDVCTGIAGVVEVIGMLAHGPFTTGRSVKTNSMVPLLCQVHIEWFPRGGNTGRRLRTVFECETWNADNLADLLEQFIDTRYIEWRLAKDMDTPQRAILWMKLPDDLVRTP